MISIQEQVNAIDIQTKDGDSLLIMAARNGLTDAVHELLNLNATITVSKDTITAASKLANEAGFQEVVELLRNATVKVTNYSLYQLKQENLFLTKQSTFKFHRKSKTKLTSSIFSVFVFLFIYL